MQFKSTTIFTSFLTALIIGSLVFGVIIGLTNLGLLEDLELIAYDWFIR